MLTKHAFSEALQVLQYFCVLRLYFAWIECIAFYKLSLHYNIFCVFSFIMFYPAWKVLPFIGGHLNMCIFIYYILPS